MNITLKYFLYILLLNITLILPTLADSLNYYIWDAGNIEIQYEKFGTTSKKALENIDNWKSENDNKNHLSNKSILVFSNTSVKFSNNHPSLWKVKKLVITDNSIVTIGNIAYDRYELYKNSHIKWKKLEYLLTNKASDQNLSGLIHVDKDSILNVNGLSANHGSVINGTINVYGTMNNGKPNSDNEVEWNFGEFGKVQYKDGSANSIITKQLGKTIFNVIVSSVNLNDQLISKVRYLVQASLDKTFNFITDKSIGLEQWQVEHGDITDTNGDKLTNYLTYYKHKTNNYNATLEEANNDWDLLASDPNKIKDLNGFYLFGTDQNANGGVFIKHITNAPEPSTSTLLLAGLSLFSLKRKRQY